MNALNFIFRHIIFYVRKVVIDNEFLNETNAIVNSKNYSVVNVIR